MTRITRRIFIVLAATLLVGGVAASVTYLFRATSEPTSTVPAVAVAPLEPAFVPEGWQKYTSTSTWVDGGRVAFAYPSQGWTLEEKYQENGVLTALLLEGGGYRIQIHQAGRDMGKPYDYITTVDGYGARTWKSDLGNGLGLSLGIIDTGFIISALTPDKKKETFDQFLQTVRFVK